MQSTGAKYKVTINDNPKPLNKLAAPRLMPSSPPDPKRGGGVGVPNIKGTPSSGFRV